MYNYQKHGEQFNPATVLGRMSEDGVCLLSGATEDLAYIPVDGDLQNILASNMACLSRKVALGILYRSYWITTVGNVELKFDIPEAFVDYNRLALEAIGMSGEPFPTVETSADLLKVFEVTTSHHVKGLYSASAFIGDETIMLDRYQYGLYVGTRLEDEKEDKSQIIV